MYPVIDDVSGHRLSYHTNSSVYYLHYGGGEEGTTQRDASRQT
jgi:hypothetical protein